jgi:hypothetical protein
VSRARQRTSGFLRMKTQHRADSVRGKSRPR